MGRQVSWVLLSCAVILAASGAWLMLSNGRQSDAGLVVQWPPQDMGQVPTGPHDIEVRVSNPGSVPRRILGVRQGCRPTVCFSSRQTEPIVVAPGQTAALVCEVHVSRPGPFEFPLRIYLEENGIREAELVIRGVGVAGQGGEGHVNTPAGR